ncbi:MAG: RDD family protein [Kiloniellaceae bacterium]
MTYNGNLPSLHLGSAAWAEAPPDPLAEPDLYDGLVYRRVAGYAVDVVLIAVLSVALGLAFGLAGVLSFGLLSPLGFAAVALLPVSYHSYFIGRRGATPGMALFDLEMRTWTGHRPDYVQAFLVTVLFYTTVTVTAWLVLAVALFNDRRRTLHDYLAGTVVVRRSRVAAGAPAWAEK